MHRICTEEQGPTPKRLKSSMGQLCLAVIEALLKLLQAFEPSTAHAIYTDQ